MYLKKLTDTPLCRCGNIEISEHFVYNVDITTDKD